MHGPMNVKLNGDAVFPFYPTSFIYRKKMYVFKITVLCAHGACAPYKLFNQLTDFHEIWYKHYAIRGNPNTRHF